jgi:hypothetical protein
MDDSLTVAYAWVAAWTTTDRRALFGLLAAGATVESNLDPDGDFVEILEDFVAAVGPVTVTSATVAPDGRVALVYDCAADPSPVRILEFLDIRGGLVHGVRRVYDLTATLRLLPHLAG